MTVSQEWIFSLTHLLNLTLWQPITTISNNYFKQFGATEKGYSVMCYTTSCFHKVSAKKGENGKVVKGGGGCPRG